MVNGNLVDGYKHFAHCQATIWMLPGMLDKSFAVFVAMVPTASRELSSTPYFCLECIPCIHDTLKVRHVIPCLGLSDVLEWRYSTFEYRRLFSIDYWRK